MNARRTIRNLSIIAQWFTAGLGGFFLDRDLTLAATFGLVSLLFLGIFLASHEMILKGIE